MLDIGDESGVKVEAAEELNDDGAVART